MQKKDIAKRVIQCLRFGDNHTSKKRKHKMIIIDNDKSILRVLLVNSYYNTLFTQRIIVSLEDFFEDNELVDEIKEEMEKRFYKYYEVVKIEVAEGTYSGYVLYEA